MLRKLLRMLFGTRSKDQSFLRFGPNGQIVVVSKTMVHNVCEKLIPREDGLGFDLVGSEPHTILGPGGDYNRPKWN